MPSENSTTTASWSTAPKPKASKVDEEEPSEALQAVLDLFKKEESEEEPIAEIPVEEVREPETPVEETIEEEKPQQVAVEDPIEIDDNGDIDTSEKDEEVPIISDDGFVSIKPFIPPWIKLASKEEMIAMKPRQPFIKKV